MKHTDHRCHKCGGWLNEDRGCDDCDSQVPREFDLSKTAIEKGGVLRCCFATVASEYEGRSVRLGDKSKCLHCGTQFTLVMVPDGIVTCFAANVIKKTPVWKPDWQLEIGSAGKTAN